jgi:hypothetical protein
MLRAFPPPSLGVAVSVTVSLIPAEIEGFAGVTSTVATATLVTVTTAGLLVTPSLVAVMLAVPAATAVTTPVEGSTDATAELSDAQVTLRPESGWPLMSVVVAVICCV